MSNSSAGRRLAALLVSEVEQIGLDLEDVEVVAAGKRRLVRVLVDKDGGVTLDDVALVSHSISEVLDTNPAAEAVLGSTAYVLEVSSPGVDRPLTEPRHWRRATGRLVKTPLTAGGEVTGRVTDVDSDGVRLAIEGSPDRALRFDEIGPGRVQVEFNRRAGDEPVDNADDGSSLSIEPEESQ